ncbi:MAG TPA: WD40 repeat domain-containing protein [Candidatus Kapabacteria bacterium]|nr:WD40 repeat domain-containing protein [Candidatus Kapabacteria bacterium]
MKTLILCLFLALSLNSFSQNLKLMHPIAKASGDYIAISPNRDIVALASNTGIIFLEANTGRLVKEIPINYAKSVTFSTDKKYLAFTYQKTIQIIDLYTDEIIMKDEEENQCYSITFSPNNEEIAFYTGSQLKTWNFKTGQFWLIETSGHNHYCYRESGVESDEIRYSSDGRYLLSVPNKNCSPTADASIWDTKMKTKTKTFNIANYPLFDINSTWTEISVITSENSIVVKDLNTLNTKKTIPLQGKFNYIKYLSSKNNVLVTNLDEYSNNPVYLVNLENGETITKPALKASKIMILDENRILTNNLYAGLKVYELSSGQIIDLFKTNTFYIENVWLSENQEYIALLAYNNNLRLLNKSFNHLIAFPNSYYKSYGAVAIPKDKNITISCGGEDVNIWDNKSGELIKKYEKILDNNWRKVISDDGTILFQYGRGGCHFSYIDLSNGSKLYEFETSTNWEPEIYSGAFYPDNKYFATGVNTRYDLTRTWAQGSRELTKEEQKRSVSIWDLEQNNLIRTFSTNHPEGIIQNIAFSHDGNYLFTTSNNEELTVMWDLTGTSIKSFKGRLQSISGDSKYLVVNSRSENGFSTIIYNISTGNKVKSIPIGGDSYVSKDGQHIINNLTSHLEVWNILSGKLEFSYYIAGDSDWVVITPDGYYDGTKNGLKEIHYSDGFKVYPLDTASDMKFKPGLIGSILK